jgi:hypothetical protein
MDAYGNCLCTNDLARICLFWVWKATNLRDYYHTFETSERIKTPFWSIFTLQRSLFETETITIT